MIIPCGYCNQDTAGNHEYNCPNRSRIATIVSEKFESWQLEQYVVEYAKLAYENQKQAAEIEQLIAGITKINDVGAELRRENQRLKELFHKIDDCFPECPHGETEMYIMDIVKEALAAQPRKGPDDENPKSSD